MPYSDDCSCSGETPMLNFTEQESSTPSSVLAATVLAALMLGQLQGKLPVCKEIAKKKSLPAPKSPPVFITIITRDDTQLSQSFYAKLSPNDSHFLAKILCVTK